MRQATALLEVHPCRGSRERTFTSFSAPPHELGTHFLVTSCVDRLAGNGEHTIAAEMNEGKISGLHEVEVRDG
ncbi:hypothetical protein [Mesorhizobium caraganae]|uniref:hypothetical protein n=1 Tax=Mesorhizobium caraganae TaxID=483206 RepID=UPI00177B4BC3|nr:hypothetical protein [Mesorhizobium caraganae]